jgi:hypothetical protein
MTKNFLYLVQTDGNLPSHYADIPNENADILYLSYKEPIEGYIHFPNSTWTTGRNRLLEEARNSKHQYLYYIFLDDDLEFIQGNWRYFEEMLLKYMPAISTSVSYNENLNPNLEAQVVYSYDAMFNAFHRDVFFDDLLLPYIDKFDDVCWYESQLIFIHISAILYPNHILQFNYVEVDNSKHNIYPKKMIFAEVEKWILENIFSDNDLVKESFLPHPELATKIPPIPYTEPLISYKIDEETKRKIFKQEDGDYNIYRYRNPTAMSYIWRGLNQLETLDENHPYCQEEINWETAYKYFTFTSKSQFMELRKLSDHQKKYLKTTGLSVPYLELIGLDRIGLEQLYIRGYINNNTCLTLSDKTTRNVENSRVWYVVEPAINFQQTIVETGYIYAVCPSTGKILKSDRSQICVGAISFGQHKIDHAAIFYRFVGEEVFYLITLEFQGDKGYIYFPRLDLVIQLKNSAHCLLNPDIINRFKADTVTNWKAVKFYISNNMKTKVVALLGIVYKNLGHYFWNEITGIQFLLENEILDKIDKFLLGKYSDTFNVGDIFPEISPDKLVPVLEKQNISKLMLENNYLAVRATDVYVKEELANRIYDNALKKCSETFIEKVEKSKKHFPFLWINLRSHDKAWNSQVEGYAKIINSLYQDYPKMAIAFDGFPDEKTTMEKIVTLIPKEITIYNILDCPLYETIVWAYSIDYYIAVISAGLTLVTWLANKPGVAHCNFGHTSDQAPWWAQVRENGIEPMFVPADCIVDLDDQHTPAYCNYDFDRQLIYDRLIKIHQKYYPQKLPDSWYQGEIIAQKYLAAEPGKKVDLKVIVKNLTNVTWSANDFSYINCGNHWLDENGKILQNDDGRVSALQQDLKPQEEIELTLAVTAPKTEGNYLLELDLVQEGVTWFKHKGSATATVEVEVKLFQVGQ